MRLRIAGFAAIMLLGTPSAWAVESWNSACLADLRQVKEDWTRIAAPKTRDAVRREVALAERSYRRGRDAECKQRVEQIKAMMR